MNVSSLFPTSPVSPVAAYIGGKRLLAKTLVPIINSTPHMLYAEPFVGMGGVFFRRDARPKVEAINDKSRDVAIFFRILQRHYEAFLDMLKWRLTSRAEFDRLMAQEPDILTDLERAARFLYLQRLSFGGKVDGRSFGISRSSPARFDLTKLVPLLEAAHERLSCVTIECLPWQDFVARWDTDGTLFFLDPPYYGVEDYYGKDQFKREEYETLATVLSGVKGRFILTLNDVPEVRSIFSFADIEPVTLGYSLSGQRTEGREVIITNKV